MVAKATTTKNIDSKGRLTLGEAYANRTVIVEEHGDGEFVLRLARVIPEREAWLYENPKALEQVRRGVGEARKGKFVKGPDLAAARKLAEQIPDSDE